MTPLLETARLILRPLELADAAATPRLFPHWEVVKYLADKVPWPYPEDGALAFYRDVVLPAVERGEEWHWSLRLRENPGQLIGAISLRKAGDENRGFWLGLPWQGGGYMTEAAEWAAAYWFEELGFPELRIAKAVDNVASRRISERSGMRVVARFKKSYVSGELDSELWEITAAEWRARRDERAAAR